MVVIPDKHITKKVINHTPTYSGTATPIGSQARLALPPPRFVNIKTRFAEIGNDEFLPFLSAKNIVFALAYLTRTYTVLSAEFAVAEGILNEQFNGKLKGEIEQELISLFKFYGVKHEEWADVRGRIMEAIDKAKWS